MTTMFPAALSSKSEQRREAVVSPALSNSSSSERKDEMNWDTMAGNWKQMKGKAKQKWAKLTDDDLTYIDGKREQLLGRIQERYGIQKDIAERELKDWERTL